MPYRYALKIAYKGSHFYGWQKTKEGPSIEQSLEEVLLKITQEKSISLEAASRTDRGVHAIGQVVTFSTTQEILHLPLFQISLHQLLPSDISCLSITSLQDNLFHPTLSAIKKKYQYTIITGKIPSPFHQETAWHYISDINIENMKKYAEKLLGEHDFKGFCNSRKNLSYDSTRRTLFEISIQEKKIEIWNMIIITVIGNSFLYKMVRNIVGTLADIASQKISDQQFYEALFLQRRTSGGRTAPAHGLTLLEVKYPIDIF